MSAKWGKNLFIVFCSVNNLFATFHSLSNLVILFIIYKTNLKKTCLKSCLKRDKCFQGFPLCYVQGISWKRFPRLPVCTRDRLIVSIEWVYTSGTFHIKSAVVPHTCLSFTFEHPLCFAGWWSCVGAEQGHVVPGAPRHLQLHNGPLRLTAPLRSRSRPALAFDINPKVWFIINYPKL